MRPIPAVPFVALMIAGLPAFANVVFIGSGTVAPDTFSAATLMADATVVANTGVQTFSFDGMSGRYQEVAAADLANTFCVGCLDFALQVSLDASQPFAMDTVRFGTWNSQTDVGYSPGLGSGTIIPSDVFRGLGNNVGFDFTNGIFSSGTSTEVLIVETDATQFWNHGIIVFNDSNNDTQSSVIGGIFVPTPEPSTLALTGLAIAALAGFRRARR